MRKLLYIGFITFGLLGCQSNADVSNKVEKTPVSESNSANSMAHFKIEGMTCEVNCAQKIEEHLLGMEGVTKSRVDFEKEEAFISFDSTLINSKTIKGEIEKLNDSKYTTVSFNANKNTNDSDSEDHTTSKNEKPESINIESSSYRIKFPNLLDYIVDLF